MFLYSAVSSPSDRSNVTFSVHSGSFSHLAFLTNDFIMVLAFVNDRLGQAIPYVGWGRHI